MAVLRRNSGDKYWNIFVNEETEDETVFDPRMTVKKLKKQDAELEELYLVQTAIKISFGTHASKTSHSHRR